MSEISEDLKEFLATCTTKELVDAMTEAMLVADMELAAAIRNILAKRKPS